MAEGIGQDARGALTLIGINQNIHIAPTLPVVTKRAIVVHLTDNHPSLKEGDKIGFKIKAVSPSGDVISAQSGLGAISPQTWADLPVTLDLPMEMILNCQEYGAYHIEFDVQFPGGEVAQATAALYVLQPQPEGDSEIEHSSITTTD